MLLLGKTFEFCASHRVYRDEWSQEKNTAVFGKCANPNGHGHNYKLEVSVSGPINPETGYILDASKLDDIVQDEIVSKIDHKHLNLDLDWFTDTTPSSENLVEAMWSRLHARLALDFPSVTLSELKLWETSRIFVVKRCEMKGL